MGYAAAVAAFVIWGIASSVLIRLIPLPGPVVSCAGSAIGAVIMLAWIGPRRWRLVTQALRAYPGRIFLLATALAGCSLTFQWAVKTTTVANAVLTHSLQPLITCLILLPLMGARRPNRRGLAALVIGLLGLGIVFWPQIELGGPWFGVIMGALSAAFFAWFNVQFAWFADKIERDVLQCCDLMIAALLLMPFSMAMDWTMPEGIGLAALIGTSLFSYVIASRFFFYAIRYAPVGHVATLAYIEPVVAIAAAALFLGEPLDGYALIGGSLVMASGVLVITGAQE